MSGRLVALVLLLAGLAGAAGYYVYARPDMRVAPRAPLASQASPAAPERRLVSTVPEFTLTDREGEPRSLSHWAGKSLIVNFWATWCAPCRREIPLLQKIERERAGQGFQVVGIAVDVRDKVLQYADQMKIQYPLLIGEQDALDAATAFGVDAIGFPFTVFTDARGRVIVAHMGELTAPEADLILGAIARVNAGQTDAAAARAEIAAKLPRPPQDPDENSAG